MNKTERQETVESLSALLKDSPHVYVTDFSGMNVLRLTEFRRRLRAAAHRGRRDGDVELALERLDEVRELEYGLVADGVEDLFVAQRGRCHCH
jgi:hypothetical protein